MKLTERLSQSPDVVSREVAGETVLLHLESGLYFGLDEVGSLIWRSLEGESRSVASLCDVVGAEFDMAPLSLEKDILAFAVSLVDQGLVESKPA